MGKNQQTGRVGDGEGLLGDNDNRKMTIILTTSEASGYCRLDMEY